MKINRRIFTPALAALALTFGVCACDGDKKAAANVRLTAQELTCDSLTWADSLVLGGCKATVNISGVYPTGGPALLVDSARGWIGNKLSTGLTDSGTKLFTPTAAQLASGQKLVELCGKSLLASARRDFEDFVKDGFDIDYEYRCSFAPVYMTDGLTTYSFSSYVYLGGAHGSSLGVGQTFVNSNGQPLKSENIFKSESLPVLTDMIRKALWTQYFSPEAEPGMTLRDFLLINPDTLSLPAAAPEFRAEGLVFIYQQYEIAPYSSGMPACTLPYAVVKPLMKPEVAALL